MIYCLLAALVLLSLASYGLCGRDFFAPATMLCLAFTFSCACALYNLSRWQLELAPRTVGVILGAVSITVGINVWAHGCFQRVRVPAWSGRESPVPVWVSAVILLALGAVLVVMLEQVRRIGGGGSLANAMVIFRAKNAYGIQLSDQLPGWVRQLLNGSAVVAFLYLFHLIRFGRRMGKTNLVLNLLILAACVAVSLLTGGRFSRPVFGHDHGGGRCCAVVYAPFGWTQRLETGDPSAGHGGGSGCSLWLLRRQNPGGPPVGGNAGGVYHPLRRRRHSGPGSLPERSPRSLRHLGQGDVLFPQQRPVDIPYYYIHHEFRQSGGTSIGNIYTALRDYHYDFGMAGMVLLHTLFSAVFSFWYEYQKKRRSHLGILIWAMVYYCVVFYPISNSFFASVVSFGFVIRLGLLVLLYFVLIQKKGDPPCRNSL